MCLVCRTGPGIGVWQRCKKGGLGLEKRLGILCNLNAFARRDGIKVGTAEPETTDRSQVCGWRRAYRKRAGPRRKGVASPLPTGCTARIQVLDFNWIRREKVIVQSGVVILDERIDAYGHDEAVRVAGVVDRFCVKNHSRVPPAGVATGWKCVVSGRAAAKANGAGRQEQKSVRHDEIGIHKVELGESLRRDEDE